MYPFPLLITKDFDIEELKATYYILLDEMEAEEIGNGFDRTPTNVAKTARIVNKQNMNIYFLVLLYRTEEITTGIIAHEAFHSNTYNCDLLGIPGCNADTDEPQAYFVQWVADCIDAIIKGKPELKNGTIFND